MILIEKTRKVFRLIYFKVCKLRLQLRKKPQIGLDRKVPVIALGTHYGGWKVPEGYLDKKSICYFAGAGIDISFDVEVARKFGTHVYIIDPTPVARQHFDTLVERTKNGEKLEINRSRDLFYSIETETLKLLHFVDLGLWSSDTTLKFFEPGNSKTMVSHSVVNLHKTEAYFEAEVVKVATLMKKLGHTRVDFLKIDIEGAEYEVIDNVIEDKLNIGVLGIEFDEVHHPLNKKSVERIEQCIQKIRDAGYLVVDVDSHFNVTFLNEQVYDRLYPKGQNNV